MLALDMPGSKMRTFGPKFGVSDCVGQLVCVVPIVYVAPATAEFVETGLEADRVDRPRRRDADRAAVERRGRGRGRAVDRVADRGARGGGRDRHRLGGRVLAAGRREGRRRDGRRRTAAVRVGEVRGVVLRTVLLVREPVVEHGAGGQPAHRRPPGAAAERHPDVLLALAGAGVVDVDVHRRRRRGERNLGLGRIQRRDRLGVVVGRCRYATHQEGRADGQDDGDDQCTPASAPDRIRAGCHGCHLQGAEEIEAGGESALTYREGRPPQPVGEDLGHHYRELAHSPPVPPGRPIRVGLAPRVARGVISTEQRTDASD